MDRTDSQQPLPHSAQEPTPLPHPVGDPADPADPAGHAHHAVGEPS